MDMNIITWVIGIVSGVLFGLIVPTVISIIKIKKLISEAKTARAVADKAKMEADEAKYNANSTEEKYLIEEAERKSAEAEAIAKAKEAKVAEAEAELYKLATKLVDETETLYKDVDSHLKQTTGKGAGIAKKAEVMTKMEITALKNGYPFETEKWSEIVDGIVKMTKNVNAKQ